MRQEATGVFHLHLNGAGGNIGAGKFNDGSPAKRQVLADKVAQGMQLAWEQQTTQPLSTSDVDWAYRMIDCPVAEHLNEKHLRALVADDATPYAERGHAAEKLAFLLRMKQGKQIQISRLKLGNTYLVFMPGELFVEYQLAAQAMQPDANVMLAAYGEYGTGYIGTRIAYPQGGYEVSERASNVPPEVEAVLLKAMRELLDAKDSRVYASDFTDTIGALPQ
jgi:hypothetical protein